MGLGMVASSNRTCNYYVMDHAADQVYILNDEWSFISVKSFVRPNYINIIGNSLYMTGIYNVEYLYVYNESRSRFKYFDKYR